MNKVSKCSLEELIGELLREHGWRLAIAESCTGGLIGHRITNVPGASTYYMGSIIAYAYEAKVRLLGVDWDTLEKFGAVSESTVREMAEGVRQALAADVGLSVSGIAGPGGGTPEKPIGYTWVALSTPDGTLTKQLMVKGNRLENKRDSAQIALKFLYKYLKSLKVDLSKN